MDVPDGGFFYSVRKFYERGASMSDFVDGPATTSRLVKHIILAPVRLLGLL